MTIEPPYLAVNGTKHARNIALLRRVCAWLTRTPNFLRSSWRCRLLHFTAGEGHFGGRYMLTRVVLRARDKPVQPDFFCNGQYVGTTVVPLYYTDLSHRVWNVRDIAKQQDKAGCTRAAPGVILHWTTVCTYHYDGSIVSMRAMEKISSIMQRIRMYLGNICIDTRGKQSSRACGVGLASCGWIYQVDISVECIGLIGTSVLGKQCMDRTRGRRGRAK